MAPPRLRTVNAIASGALIVAAAMSVLAACAADGSGSGAPAARSASSSGSASAAGSSTAVVDPLAEQRAQAPLLGAGVSPDGEALRLYVLGDDPTVAAGSLTATFEDGTDPSAMRVLVRRVGAGVPSAPAVVCRLAHDVHVLDITLDEPLDGRVLLDATNGSRIEPTAFDSILRPASLPEGWRLLDEHPLREGDRQRGWTQRYGASDAEPTISVVQRLASLGPIERYEVDRAEQASVPVRATLATWSRQGNWDATSLVWTEGQWTVALSSSSPDGRMPAHDQAALVAFAEGLRAGADGPIR